MIPFKLITLTSITSKGFTSSTIDGESIVDITKQSFDTKKVFPRVSQQPILVTADLSGKPHLISKILYGSEDYVDVMMYFNGISNPLMIVEGMQLTVYNLDDMLNCIVNLDKDKENNISKSNFNNKLNKVDKARIDALQKKNGNRSGDIKSPSMISNNNQQPVTPINGRIVLGTNVVENRCQDNLTETQKTTELIRKAVRDKLKQSNDAVESKGLI